MKDGNKQKYGNKQKAAKGALYLVAAPLGNFDDITLRALNTLAEVDVVAAEDTRNTGLLLAHHGLKKKLISFHEHNEGQRTEQLVSRLSAGELMALITDAGTPSICDPGYRLVQGAIQADVRIIPLPGPCAAVTALSASGLPVDEFVFVGFPPKAASKRQLFLKNLAKESRTIIFYISPKQLLSFMAELIAAMGDRQAVLAREMTKPYEEFIRGTLSLIDNNLRQRKAIKGELTLIIQGSQGVEEVEWKAVIKEISDYLADPQLSVNEIVQQISSRYGLSRNQIYRKVIEMRSGFN